jgi:hypothetical protein
MPYMRLPGSVRPLVIDALAPPEIMLRMTLAGSGGPIGVFDDVLVRTFGCLSHVPLLVVHMRQKYSVIKYRYLDPEALASDITGSFLNPRCRDQDALQ